MVWVVSLNFKKYCKWFNLLLGRKDAAILVSKADRAAAKPLDACEKKLSSSKIVDFFRTAFGAFIRRSELFPAKYVPDIRASQKQGKEGGLLK
jgi:hypothetical protein